MQADIRAARASDVDALLAIENSVFAIDRLSRVSLRRLVSSPSAAALVAICDGAVAGYCVVLFRSGSRKARLYSIAVGRDFAGAGLGRRFLDAAEASALARGCGMLRLEVREDNAGAIRLYESAGYQREGRVPVYYADGEAALRFAKLLDRAGAGDAEITSSASMIGATTIRGKCRPE